MQAQWVGVVVGGGEADRDPHGHSALETGPSAGRGSAKQQARWAPQLFQGPRWPGLGTDSQSARTRRGLAISKAGPCLKLESHCRLSWQAHL